MNTYRIRLVGEPMGPWTDADAHTATDAIARLAGCDWRHVGVEINRPYPGAARYMPTDDSGRQWEVIKP